MFQLNDTVFYGVHGVCTVTDISKRNFCGSVSDYYTLKPVYTNRSTVFVPVEKQELAGKMRKLLSEKEIRRLIEDLPNRENLWVDNDAIRKETYANILKQGSVSQLAALIKTLYEHRLHLAAQNKKMHAADERVLAEAERMLHEEFAYVLKIDKDQVVSFISEQLHAAMSGEEQPEEQKRAK